MCIRLRALYAPARAVRRLRAHLMHRSEERSDQNVAFSPWGRDFRADHRSPPPTGAPRCRPRAPSERTPPVRPRAPRADGYRASRGSSVTNGVGLGQARHRCAVRRFADHVRVATLPAALWAPKRGPEPAKLVQVCATQAALRRPYDCSGRASWTVSRNVRSRMWSSRSSFAPASIRLGGDVACPSFLAPWWRHAAAKGRDLRRWRASSPHGARRSRGPIGSKWTWAVRDSATPRARCWPPARKRG